MGNRPAAARRGPDLSRAVFYAMLCVTLLGLSFVLGLEAGARRTTAYHVVHGVADTVRTALKVTAEEAPTLAGLHPTHFLQPRRRTEAGVTINRAGDGADDLILLSGFFGGNNELRLIRRDGGDVARWPVRYRELFPRPDHLPAGSAPANDWYIDTHGAVALPDGSVVFNFEYGGLVKLDRCNRLVWAVRRRTHHSVERAGDGGFWVGGRRRHEGPSPFPPFDAPFEEDTILKISEDGEVTSELSVPAILYGNGLQAVLTATGSRFRSGMSWDRELVHVNKIAELSADLAADFPMFASGDLVLSIRELNLVMVVDPEGRTVKWWRVGPWLRQHDPEFRRGGTIVVFNNNMFDTEFGPTPFVAPPTVPRVSNIIEIDPVSDRWQVVYGGQPGEELSSVNRGKVDLTPQGGLFITEFEGGRVLETDANRHVVWEYVNQYSDTETAEISEARLYPSGYFTVRDWTCREA
jgi:hypothetical protein